MFNSYNYETMCLLAADAAGLIGRSRCHTFGRSTEFRTRGIHNVGDEDEYPLGYFNWRVRTYDDAYSNAPVCEDGQELGHDSVSDAPTS